MDLVTAGAALMLSKKLLGKTFDVVSVDISKLYEKGRDKIIEKTTNKVSDENDGKSTNLRVTRDVFWNGSFTDEAICAEYFGGILASSRSEDGQDDTGVYYVDLIKSLSSSQLKLHYVIYLSLNKLFILDNAKSKINPAQASELSSENIYFSTNEIIINTSTSDILRDIHAIYAKGLIGNFKVDSHQLDGHVVPYLKVSPQSLGVQLFAVAYNKLDLWLNFPKFDFKCFESIDVPKFYGESIDELIKRIGII